MWPYSFSIKKAPARRSLGIGAKHRSRYTLLHEVAVSSYRGRLHFLFDLLSTPLYILYNLGGCHRLPFYLFHIAIVMNILQSFTSRKLLLYPLSYFFLFLLSNFSSWHLPLLPEEIFGCYNCGDRNP